MSTSKRKRSKKYFTAAEANATLPLVRVHRPRHHRAGRQTCATATNA